MLPKTIKQKIAPSLIIFLVLLAGGLFYLIVNLIFALQEDSNVYLQFRGDSVWASSQLQSEHCKLLNLVYHEQLNPVKWSDIGLRYEILLSRLSLFQTGMLSEQLKEETQLQELVQRISQEIEAVEPLVLEREDGNEQILPQLLEKIAPISSLSSRLVSEFRRLDSIKYNQLPLQQRIEQVQLILWFLLGVLIVLIAGMARSLRLTSHARDKADTMVIELSKAYEQLEILNQSLDEKVQNRTKELENRSNELSQTVHELKETQSQLVQSEKMAALGGLVAGMAHEVNTPLGVAVTASSLLKTKVLDLESSFQSGTIKRSDMQRFLASTQKSSDLLLDNLQRADQLVQSFKQVAVNQSNEVKQNFHLKKHISTVLQHIETEWGPVGHKVQIEVDQEIQIDSYPNVFTQILVNLIKNSILHAYPPEQQGTICINATQEAYELNLLYRDDGEGIDPEILPKIFDPFCTTKRGQGLAGLGLHIVYNLVTQMLKGQITCVSKAEEGTQFEIKIPFSSLN